MSWRSWIVALLLAASCAAPEPPEAWSVERVTPLEDGAPDETVCNDIRVFALGETIADLDATLTELARISALTGATAALPLLEDIVESRLDPTAPIDQQAVATHDLLVLASRTIDDASSDSCGIPAFSAMYAASGFPSCYFEVDIPVAGYTLLNEAPLCDPNSGPDSLPCWSNDGNHVAVDCVTEELVHADGKRWVPAGEPRE
ncbi:MAG: hypothetical protein ACI9MX_003444, partial [Candidatus Aldehydirespiratoraceae bacterium]